MKVSNPDCVFLDHWIAGFRKRAVEGTVIDNRVVVDTVEQLLGKNDSPNQPM